MLYSHFFSGLRFRDRHFGHGARAHDHEPRLQQQHSGRSGKHALRAHITAVRQRHQAEERGKLAPEHRPHCFRPSEREPGDLIKADRRGAQGKNLYRVGRDGGVHDVHLIAHDQPKREQQNRQRCNHHRTRGRLLRRCAAQLHRERDAHRDRRHGQNAQQRPLQLLHRHGHQQNHAAEHHHPAKNARRDPGDAARRAEHLGKRLRLVHPLLIFQPQALHAQHDRRHGDPRRDQIRPGGAGHGQTGVLFKADLILQPAEKRPEGGQYAGAAADG